MQTFLIKDKQGRILLRSNGDRCLLSRYPDMEIETKQELAEFFAEVTGKPIMEVKEFLDYRSAVQELCS